MDLISEWIWTPPNDVVYTEQKLSQLKIVQAIDISGSTSNYSYADPTKDILDLEVGLAQKFDNSNDQCIAWHSDAKIDKLDKLRSSACTNPENIYHNPQCLDLIKKSNVLILYTDGEISANNIVKHSIEVSKHCNHLNMTIGVLILDRCYKSPGMINISVLSSAMISNSLILCNRVGGVSILWATGDIAMKLPYIEITDTTLWKDIPIIQVSEILNATVVLSNVEPPVGYSKLSNDMYIATDKLLTNNISYSDFKQLPLQTLLKTYRDLGKLNEFRHWLKNIEQPEIDKILKQVNDEDITDENLIKEVDDLYEKLLTLDINDPNRDTIRNKYIECRNKIQSIIKIKDDKLKQLLTPIKSTFADLYYNIHELQSSSYNLVSMNINLQSNRAKRMDLATDFNIEHIYELDHTNSLKTECSICYQEDTTCILLRKHKNPEENTNDYSLNWPLATGCHNTEILSPTLVCTKCAEYFVNRKQDTVRVETTHALPMVSLATKENRSYITSVLAKTLTAGVNVSNLFLFYFSMLDHVSRHEWAKTEEWSNLVKFTKNELLTHIITNKALNDVSNKVKLKDALAHIVTTPDIFNQPLPSVLLILRNIKEFKLSADVRYEYILRTAIIRQMVQSYSTGILNKNKNLITYANDILFEMKDGVPLANSTRLCSISNKLTDLLIFKDTQTDIIRTCKKLEFTLNSVISDNMYTTIIWIFHNYLRHQQHLKLEQTMNLLIKFPDFDMIVTKDIVKLPNIVEIINTKMFPHKKLTDIHRQSSEFYTIYGPSTCYCICGKSFLPDIQGPGTKLKDIVEIIRYNRDHHIAESYGSFVPNDKSGHYNLHKFVATTIVYNFRDATETSNEIIQKVIDKIIETQGAKGDIFTDTLRSDVEFGVNSYFKALHAGKVIQPYGRNTEFVPFEEKTRYELKNLGKLNDADEYLK